MCKHLNKIKNNSNNNRKQYVSAMYTNILPNIIKNELKKISTFLSVPLIIKKHIYAISTNIKGGFSGVYRIQCDEHDKFYIGENWEEIF